MRRGEQRDLRAEQLKSTSPALLRRAIDALYIFS
jgi:hypothetical protein